MIRFDKENNSIVMATTLYLDSGLPLNYKITLSDNTINLLEASSITMMVRPQIDSEVILATLSVGNGRIAVDVTEPWKMAIFLDSVDATDFFNYTSVSFDIVVRFPDESVNPPIVIARLGTIRPRLLVTR